MRILITAGCLLAATAVGWSGTLITSYPNGDGGAFSIAGQFGQSVAAGFTMGGGPDFSLDSATLRLSFVGIASFPGNVLQVSLYGDSGGNPSGPALVAFTPPAGTLSAPGANGFTDYTLLPASSFTLQAGTTYWLVVTSDTGGNLGAASASTAATGSAATDAGFRTGPGSPPSTVSSSHLLYEIDGTAITAPTGDAPEPLTAGLAGVGILAIAWLKRQS
jgi:hypothetical protein